MSTDGRPMSAIVEAALAEVDRMHEERPLLVPRFDRGLLPERRDGELGIMHVTRCLDVIQRWAVREAENIERLKEAARLSAALPPPVGDS